MKKILIIPVSILIYLNGFSQNAAEVIKNINMAYYKTANYYFDFEYKVYYNNIYNSSIVGNVNKHGNLWYYSIKDQLECLRTEKYLLNIDHEEKLAVIQKNQNKKFDYPEILTVDFEGILKSYLKTETGKTGDMGYLRIYYKSGLYEYCEIKYDPISYLILKITISYKEPMEVENNVFKKIRMDMNFNINLNPIYNKNDFDISKYLFINNKKVELNSNYKKYELLDYYTENAQ